jgi:large repetitive protein
VTVAAPTFEQHQLSTPTAATGAITSKGGDSVQMKSGASKSARRGVRNAAIAAVLLAAFTAVGIALGAAPAVSEPTITSAPASLTSQSSATFAFTDSQAGVSFQCQLDGSVYASCVSGVKYTGLTDGNHTFKVQAVSGTKNSSAATYKWTVDSTPPSPSLTFPDNGGVYNATGWAEGCSPAGVCGKVKDTQGVTAVLVSIRQGTGNWWGGSSFNKTSETFNAATLESPGAKSSAWRYPIALPPAGSYTVHVRATDEAGNTTAAGSQAETTFTIKTAAPHVPTIQSGPEEETSEKSATFTFSDSDAGVSFLCAKDEAKFSPCTSPKTYETASQGEHTFFVQARDAAGNVSAAAQYSWTIFTKTFSIEGKLSGTLAPGVSQPLALTITNPNTKAIVVTGLQVTVASGSTKAGCDGPTNLQVTQSNASSSNTFTVPAKGKATVPTGSVSAPQVLMKNLPTNQDACKGATFTFNYSGNAHS